jgi:hypothetical protein
MSEWIVSFRVKSSEPVPGNAVQAWAQEHAAFLSGQDTLPVSSAGEVRWEVAAIEKREVK